MTDLRGVPVAKLPSPCYAIDEALLDANLTVLSRVQKESGAKIILALKGFANWATFPQLNQVLAGSTASSLHEALLGDEFFGGEVHVYAVAYKDDEIDAIADLAHHLTFNSLSQWERLQSRAASRPDAPSCGLRINPGYSEVDVNLYNPCRPGTRFGVDAATLASWWDTPAARNVEGLHFHSLCEQGADVLARTWEKVSTDFAPFLEQVKWLNMGGGHHITRPGYDIDLLVEVIHDARTRFNLDVILEPGEAVALNTGYLVCEVIDAFPSANENILILDTSATAHMPDVLEMPYRPEILGGALPGEKPHTYTLGGLTCLAGDVIGQWSFDQPVAIGDRLVFTDMAHYTMVKNTTFNGVPLPSIALFDSRDGTSRVVREFGYDDFKSRLG